MSKTEIVCLKVSGSSIPYYMGKLLAFASIKLHQDKKEQIKLKGEGYEGVLVCSYKRHHLSGMSGVGFSSTIEYDVPESWGGGSRRSEIVFFVEDKVLDVDLSEQIKFTLLDPSLN
jgi:hypothetical protein